MKKKEFKAESKKLLNLMINSIYTNKEIFLRELISNSSDALDKLYYESLTNENIKINKDDLKIRIVLDKDNRTMIISDNGCGMNKDELENNLGTIARSGSELFKEKLNKDENVNIIGQFGVGFYSSFMVSDKIEVKSRKYDSTESNLWTSTGVEGYTIDSTTKENMGTDIILHIKANDENNNYDNYLDSNEVERLIKKYSNYIAYPIIMNDGKEDKILNSMVPIWKKDKKDVTDEEYNTFYIDKFYDYEKPVRVIKSRVEGAVSYDSLMFIPSHAPYNYYNKEYEKGLELYSSGVMIMEKCDSLLPDYFSFVKGIVDSLDLELNISRETLQKNYQIGIIAKSIEKKIKSELLDLLKENRSDYLKFYKEFGNQLKYGIYSTYGVSKEVLEDLLMFYTTKDKDLVTLEEYISRLKEGQDKIYYASGETVDKIDKLPQVENTKEKGYEVLLLSDYLDEFTIKALNKYQNYEFVNVLDEKFDLDTEDEKKEIQEVNEKSRDMLSSMLGYLDNNVKEIRFTNKLKSYPVSLASLGDVSIEMEKVLNNMPGENVKANKVLEINNNHTISSKIKELYDNGNQSELEHYTKILYALAREINGLSMDNPVDIANLVCDIIAK